MPEPKMGMVSADSSSLPLVVMVNAVAASQPRKSHRVKELQKNLNDQFAGSPKPSYFYRFRPERTDDY